MNYSKTTLAAAVLAFALPGAALANNHGKGEHANHGSHGSHAGKSKAPRAKACPPGLAKKNPGCLPPGQWRKGDRLPDSWIAHYIAYAALPDFYRNRYPVRSGYRYLYQDGKVIVVEAVTRAVVDIILR